MGLRSLYYILTGKHRWREVTRKGINYRLSYQDNHGRALLKRGIWEKPQIDYLTALISKNPVNGFIDIGSCFGFYAVWMVRKQGIPQAWAFEANPDTFTRLQDHVSRNRVDDQIECFNLALSDQPGTFPFWVKSSDHPGGSKLAKSGEPLPEGFEKTIEIPVQTLDEVLSLSGQSLLMKIDIEGNELPALQGATRLLANNKIIMQVESFSHNRDQLTQHLQTLGFRFHRLIHDDLYFSNYDDLQLNDSH